MVRLMQEGQTWRRSQCKSWKQAKNSESTESGAQVSGGWSETASVETGLGPSLRLSPPCPEAASQP